MPLQVKNQNQGLDKLGRHRDFANLKNIWQPLMPKTTRIANASHQFGDQLFWGISNPEINKLNVG